METPFNQYLRLLATTGTGNKHFDQQMSICDPCQLRISFLGRTETLESDLDFLINNATNFRKALKYHRSEPGSPKLKQTLYWKLKSEQVDLEALLMFLWRYRLDYLAFGYNPHEALKKYRDVFGTN